MDYCTALPAQYKTWAQFYIDVRHSLPGIPTHGVFLWRDKTKFSPELSTKPAEAGRYYLPYVEKMAYGELKADTEPPFTERELDTILGALHYYSCVYRQDPQLKDDYAYLGDLAGKIMFMSRQLRRKARK